MKPALIACLLLTGCASMHEARLPGCHGARRPANPYGSVLVTSPDQVLPAPATSEPAGGCGGRR